MPIVNGAFDIDERTERPGNDNLFDFIFGQVLRFDQRPYPQPDRRLRQLQFPNILLRNGNRFLRRAFQPAQTPVRIRAAHQWMASHSSRAIQHVVQAQLGNNIQQTGAADADWRLPPMVWISNLSPDSRTCSIAPGAARMPNLMCAPSKAGPEAQETLVSLP